LRFSKLNVALLLRLEFALILLATLGGWPLPAYGGRSISIDPNQGIFAVGKQKY
jgi:hypothetical protein